MKVPHESILVLSVMFPQIISTPESFIAKVAGDDDPFKMVCFNVIFYGTAHPFLSTYFAKISFAICTWIVVSAFFHH